VGKPAKSAVYQILVLPTVYIGSSKAGGPIIPVPYPDVKTSDENKGRHCGMTGRVEQTDDRLLF